MWQPGPQLESMRDGLEFEGLDSLDVSLSCASAPAHVFAAAPDVQVAGSYLTASNTSAELSPDITIAMEQKAAKTIRRNKLMIGYTASKGA